MPISITNQGIRPGVCLSTAKPESPFIGQVIYMSDTDETAVWEGTYWEGLNRSKDRNVVINGAMQVHQRGTSTTSITTENLYTADRWRTVISSLGTWTQTVENDAPTGSGFRKSLKMNCTTADASPSANDYLTIATKLEGQNVQHFLKGTASAKQFSLSFWVKSNVTGTYIAELIDNDNSRRVSASYSVSASATWEKKMITFPADTTGVLDNDNAASLDVNFWLGAGSTFTGGSPLQTTWGTATNTRATGQTNLAAATNNYWQITGVQLEAGSVATPFEFEDYGTTLAKCQRYYYLHLSGVNVVVMDFSYYNASYAVGTMRFPVTMRATPTLNATSGVDYYYFYRNNGFDNFDTLLFTAGSTNAGQVYSDVGMSGTAGQAGWLETKSPLASIAFSAEL